MRLLPEFASGADTISARIYTDFKVTDYVELVVSLDCTKLENLVKGAMLPLISIEDEAHRIPILREFLFDMLCGLLAQLRLFKGFDQAAGKMLVVPSNLSLTMLLIGIG